MANDNGFTHDGEKIKGFTAKCESCGSANVKIEYEFNYYGGYTGYDQSLAVICKDCEAVEGLSIY